MTRLLSLLRASSPAFSTYAQSGVPQESIHPELEGQELLDALRADYFPDGTLGYDQARDTLFAVLNLGRV